jgi:hypothetical protein
MPTDAGKDLMSLIMREMQIKTTMRYHITAVGIIINQENTSQQMLAKMWRNGILSHC